MIFEDQFAVGVGLVAQAAGERGAEAVGITGLALFATALVYAEAGADVAVEFELLGDVQELGGGFGILLERGNTRGEGGGFRCGRGARGRGLAYFGDLFLQFRDRGLHGLKLGLKQVDVRRRGRGGCLREGRQGQGKRGCSYGA